MGIFQSSALMVSFVSLFICSPLFAEHDDRNNKQEETGRARIQREIELAKPPGSISCSCAITCQASNAIDVDTGRGVHAAGLPAAFRFRIRYGGEGVSIRQQCYSQFSTTARVQLNAACRAQYQSRWEPGVFCTSGTDLTARSGCTGTIVPPSRLYSDIRGSE